ncbi:MAG: 6-bladed beta-propeller [Mediterranea massiliensis]|nr:6-bladed beta-propeller [Mediterranea massiliensis]
MSAKILYGICFIGLLLSACTGGSKQWLNENEYSLLSALDEQPIVASVEMVNSDSVWTFHYSKLGSDTLTFPLSEFVEELNLLKLDGSDEALVPVGRVIASENYLLVQGKQQIPYKLFDKKGRFIANIGSFGQGPGEYQLIYDEQIDEPGNRIYLLPWNAKALLAYDLQGNFVQSIPLPTIVPKGMFKADTKKSQLQVFLLPFKHLPFVAWNQTFDGHILDTIPSRHLAIQPDFSNEVYSNKNSTAFDVSLFTFWERRPDTLYHHIGNRLKPQFTMEYSAGKMPIHSYWELPGYFTGDVAVEKQLSENTFSTEKPIDYIIDKQSLRGCYYKVMNDLFGGVEITYFAFKCRYGYYCENWEPAHLQETLQTILNNKKDLSDSERQRLMQLMGGITENDNNYIVWGKLK